MKQINEIKAGDLIKIYDSCIQNNVIEPVVMVFNDLHYGKLIYSKRENWLGYDERLSIIKDVKEIVTT